VVAAGGLGGTGWLFSASLASRATTAEAEFLSWSWPGRAHPDPKRSRLLVRLRTSGRPERRRRIVAPALWQRGVGRITVFLSHADQDHYTP